MATPEPRVLTSEQRALADASRGLVYWAVNRWRWLGMDRDEAVSMGYEVLCVCAALWDPKRGISFSTYVTRSLFNRFVRHCSIRGRKRDSFKRWSRDQEGGHGVDEPPADDVVHVREKLYDALASLPNRERSAVVTFYALDGIHRSFQEKAVSVSLSRQGLVNVARRGVDHLRRMLEHELQELEPC